MMLRDFRFWNFFLSPFIQFYGGAVELIKSLYPKTPLFVSRFRPDLPPADALLGRHSSATPALVTAISAINSFD